MTKGMIYKFFWIIFLIGIAVALILPTVGEKRLKITLYWMADSAHKKFINKRFSEYDISETGRNLTVTTLKSDESNNLEELIKIVTELDGVKKTENIIIKGKNKKEKEKKALKIIFEKNISVDTLSSLDSKIPKNIYKKVKEEGYIIIKGSNITDAIMNEVRIFKGVKEVEILKHPVETILLAKKINLGLDLQGGMHVVLQADYDKIRNQLEDKKVELLEKIDSIKDDKKKKKEKEDFEYQLDLITSNRLNDDGTLKEAFKQEITEQALESLRNRIDKFGVSEPSIRPRGVAAIEIQLPGVKDPKQVKAAIGTTGSLEYRFVDEPFTDKARGWAQKNYKGKEYPEDWELQKIMLSEISKGIKLTEKFQVLFFYKRDDDSKKIIPDYPMVLSKDVVLAGTDIQDANDAVDQEYNRIIVQFRTTAEGAGKLAEATSKKNHGKRLAIVLDNKIRNAPSINEQIASGSGQISGGFSSTEAQTLSRIIKEGALPVDLNIIEERTVGPSLGQDSIESGIKAIVIGLLGVMIFMLFYYKLAGIIANFGLILNLIFMLAILSLLGFTLTLPGIAAFILTVGMAVDANVIIYERIKEEIANGKSFRMSIVSGFDKAFWTIIDANLTTIIAAFILSQFGTGPIKGFAVTLFIGILSSMFVVLYITRYIYEIISLSKRIKKLSI